MKAILISAGQGSRLLPLTHEMPKCLIAVNGRTILDHQILALRTAGIEDIVVVGGYRIRQIADHLARSPYRETVSLILNPFWSVANSISSVWAAKAWLEGPFCLVNGDTIFDASVIIDAIAELAPGMNLLVEACRTPGHDDMRVEVKNGRILAVTKDLTLSRATHRSLGIVISQNDDGGLYYNALERVIGTPEGYKAYHHAVIDLLASSCLVTPIVNQSGTWCEIDRPEDIQRWAADHAAGAPA